MVEKKRFTYIVPFLCFILSYLMQNATSLSLVLFILGIITALFSLYWTKWPRHGMGFMISIFTLMITVSFQNWVPDWVVRISKLCGTENGLSIKRFANMEWDGNPVKTDQIFSVHFFKNSETLKGDNFSLLFEGFLFCPENGMYEFFLGSDDGSFLTIDNQEILSNPGLHAFNYVNGDIYLKQGFHPIELKYFNETSDAGIALEWILPGKTRQLLNTQFLFVSKPDDASFSKFKLAFAAIDSWIKNLAWFCVIIYFLRYLLASRNSMFSGHSLTLNPQTYPDSIKVNKPLTLLTAFVLVIGILLILWLFFLMPAYSPLNHQFEGVLYGDADFRNVRSLLDGKNAQFNSVTHRKFQQSNFSAKFKGFIRIQKSGVYSFSLQADDGARLFIDDTVLIDRWRAEPREAYQESIRMTVGFHEMRLELHNEFLPTFMKLQWKPPGLYSFRSIPLQQLYAEMPSQNKLELDLLYFKIRYVLMVSTFIVLLGICCLIYGSAFTSKLIPARWKQLILYLERIDKKTVSYLSISLVICAILFQANHFDTDYQYGFQWFISLNSLNQILIAIGFIALSISEVRLFLKKILHLIFGNHTVSSVTFVTSVSMIIYGQYLLVMSKHPDIDSGTVYIFAGCFLIAVNRIFLDFNKEQELSDGLKRSSPAFWILFTTIVAVSIFFRFHRISQMPPGLWWDEAQTGIVARDILNGNYPPLYDLRLNAGTLASYGMSAWFYLFGSSITDMRMYTATIGVITTIASFWFFRLFFARMLSLFGMSLIAISRWLFSINRNTMATIDETILLTFLVLIFYIRAIRSGKVASYLITGILLGVGLHLHTGARVLPLIIGMDIVVHIIKGKTDYLHHHLKGAIIMIVAAIIAFSPMLYFIVQHPDTYFKRSKETLMSSEYPGYYPAPILGENIINYMKMYTYSGDWHPRHNIKSTPQLAPWISVLFLIGISVAISKPSREGLLLLLGFVLISFQGIVTVHSGTANLNRVAENIPIVHACAVYGGFYLFAGFRRILNKSISVWLTAFLLLAVFWTTAAKEFKLYFIDHIQDRSIVGVFGFQPELTEPALRIERHLLEDPTIHIWAEYTNTDSFRYIQPPHPRLHDLTDRPFPIKPLQVKAVFYVLAENEKLTEKVRQEFPGAIEEEYPYSLDSDLILYRSFFVPLNSDY